ncbi:MAG: monovalent cation/H+ antiporter subunit D family protein [Burkholderiales bacterium]|nr:monovalent cation/H+ antiporter subunit D family protein [Burkholderiales bacterium]
MIAAHLPALQVVVPLVAAPLVVLLRSGRAGWLIAAGVSVASLAGALALAARVRAEGVLSYALGSWQPPYGIEYRIDAVNAFVLVLVGLVAAVVVPFGRPAVAAEVAAERRYLFYAMLCLALAGLNGIAITGDAFNLFVFLEISSLSSYVLIALGRDRRALVASFQYLIMGTIGATFIVIGVGLLYLQTGTLNMADIAARLEAPGAARATLAALAFLTVGICLKLALFPLHMWLPNAYTYAPSVVTAFLAATATKVSVYVLLRFWFTIFGANLVFERLPMPDIFLALSVLAMFVASGIAVYQRNLKRMLAYSSVGQIGYMTLGISLDNVPGLTGSVVHLFNHGVTKGAMFLFAGAIAMAAGTVDLDRLGGLAKRMPLTCAGLVIGGFSLIGVPATAGFVTKWYLVLAGLEKGSLLLAALPAASSLVAIAYVWRFVEAAYMREAHPDLAGVKEGFAAPLVGGWILIAICLYVGIDSTWTVEAARRAAAQLLFGAPQ